jgi:hypothetical protein
MERDNLDAIRMMEAERRFSIAPGDLRYWQTKEIPDDNLYAETPSDWRIMIAEIEAIHGKRFDDEPWLQKYFEERYWYKPNPNYDQSILNEFERKNLEKLNAKRNEDRNIAVAVGDMDRFQNVLLTEDLLKNLSMNDLRMMRNEFWARRGRKFTTPGFKQMFEWRDWYKPEKDQSKVKLNEIEEQNVKLLEREEAKLAIKLSTSRLPPKWSKVFSSKICAFCETRFTPGADAFSKMRVCKNTLRRRLGINLIPNLKTKI